MSDHSTPYPVPGLPPGWTVTHETGHNLNSEIERELVAFHPQHGRVRVSVGRRVSDGSLQTLRQLVKIKGSVQIGTCSLCGGAVLVTEYSASAVSPKPTCTKCGAVAVVPQASVIMMQPRTTADTLSGAVTKVRDV